MTALREIDKQALRGFQLIYLCHITVCFVPVQIPDSSNVRSTWSHFVASKNVSGDRGKWKTGKRDNFERKEMAQVQLDLARAELALKQHLCQSKEINLKL